MRPLTEDPQVPIVSGAERGPIGQAQVGLHRGGRAVERVNPLPLKNLPDSNPGTRSRATSGLLQGLLGGELSREPDGRSLVLQLLVALLSDVIKIHDPIIQSEQRC